MLELVSTRSVASMVRGTRGCTRGRLSEGAVFTSIVSVSMRVVAIAIRALAQGTTHPRGCIATIYYACISIYYVYLFPRLIPRY